MRIAGYAYHWTAFSGSHTKAPVGRSGFISVYPILIPPKMCKLTHALKHTARIRTCTPFFFVSSVLVPYPSIHIPLTPGDSLDLRSLNSLPTHPLHPIINLHEGAVAVLTLNLLGDPSRDMALQTRVICAAACTFVALNAFEGYIDCGSIVGRTDRSKCFKGNS